MRWYNFVFKWIAKGHFVEYHPWSPYWPSKRGLWGEGQVCQGRPNQWRDRFSFWVEQIPFLSEISSGYIVTNSYFYISIHQKFLLLVEMVCFGYTLLNSNWIVQDRKTVKLHWFGGNGKIIHVKNAHLSKSKKDNFKDFILCFKCIN